MSDLAEFSQTVSQIHAASAAPGRWHAAVSDLAQRLGARACTVALGAGADREIFSTNIDPEASAAYESYYHTLDFVASSCESSPVGSVNSGWGLVARNKQTEFHVDWQQRYGMTDGLTVRLLATRPATLYISAPPSSRPFGTAQRIQFVDALVPHLQHALSTYYHLGGGSLDGVGESRIAHLVSHAVFMVGEKGRVIGMNDIAQDMARVPDGITIRNNRVRAAAVETDSQLQAAIGRASPVRHGPRVGGFLMCRRPSGKRAYVVRVVPTDAADDPRHAQVAVVVVDPDKQPVPARDLLRAAFGLSAAEYDVATRLLRGAETKVIAEDLSVSIATIKTHLQRIFHKTGTRRQAELVRLLFALST